MTDDPEVLAILQAEEDAMQVAQHHIELYTPFLLLPTTVQMRMLSEYRKLLASIGITGEEASVMIRGDLRHATHELRGLTSNMLHLGSARHGVLLHVALLIGIEAVREMSGLWEALRDKRYDDAANALMLSEWPRMAGSDAEERRRVLDLADVIRRGTMTTAATSRVQH